MFWIIIAYLALTAIAIYFANDEGVFTFDSVMVKFTRIAFLLIIGWFIVLLTGIGVIVIGIGFHMAKQTVGYRLDHDFYIIDWIGRQLKKFVKLIIPKRKKKEEAETCPTESQTDSPKGP